jgi:hypothetical protein
MPRFMLTTFPWLSTASSANPHFPTCLPVLFLTTLHFLDQAPRDSRTPTTSKQRIPQ